MWAWKAALLLLAVGASAISNPAWKYGSTYQYELSGRTLASLHQVSNQYSGVLFKAELAIDPVKTPQKSLYARLSTLQYAQLQRNLSEGWDSQIPEDELEWEEVPLSSENFFITVNDSKVTGLLVNEDSETWEDNIRKAIASLLQVDTSNAMQANEVKSVYQKIEDSVTGEHSVTYQISELPQYTLLANPELAPLHEENETLINIEKSINFGKSRQRIEYHSGYTGADSWHHVSNTKRSSVSRIVITGNLQDYTIQSSVTKNKMVVQLYPYKEQSGMVVSLMNLTLVDVGPCPFSAVDRNPDISKLRKKHHDIVYDYENPFGYEEPMLWRSTKYDSSESSSRSSSSSSEQQSSSSEENGSSSSSSQENSRQVSQKPYESEESERYKRKIMGIPSKSMKEAVSRLNEQHKYQQMPGLKNPPNIPFLPFYVANKGQSINKDDLIIDDVQTAKKLAIEVANRIESQEDEHTLAMAQILVDIVRIMNDSKILKTEKQLQRHELARQLFRDAVAEAGTGPALTVLSQWTISGAMQGEEAAQRFAVLPRTALIPNAEYMQLFFNTTRHPKVQSQKQLQQDMLLAFTELLRQVQVDKVREHQKYPVHTFGSLTPKNNTDLERLYIPYVELRLINAVKEGDGKQVQAAIRALQNIGHKRALKTLHYYLENKTNITSFERLLIVSSMDPMSELHPEKARAPLLKLYQNAKEPNQIRSAAVLQIMKTNPPPSILQEMAETSNQDLDMQVVSAIKSAIQSASQLKKNETLLPSIAKAAVNLLSPRLTSYQHSQVNFKDGVSDELGLSYSQILSYIGSDNSLIPNALFFKLRRAYQDESQYQAMVSDVNSLIEEVQQKIVNSSRPSQDSQESGSSEEYSESQKKSRKQAQGNVMFSILGQSRFLPYDVEDIVRIALAGNASLSGLLKKGGRSNYTKFFNEMQISVGFPSAMGIPAIYKLSTPSVLHVSAGLRSAKTDPSSTKPTFNVSVDLHVKYASKLDVKIGAVTPFNGKKYIAGIKQTASISIPLNATVAYESDKARVSANVTLREPQQNHRILSYQNEPYTAQINVFAVEPESLGSGSNHSAIHVRQPKTLYNESVGVDSTGMVFRVQYQTEKQYNRSNTLMHEDKKKDPLLLAYFPLSEKSIHAWNISVDYDAVLSSASQVRLIATFGSANNSHPIFEDELSEETSTEQIEVSPASRRILTPISVLRKRQNPAEPNDESPDSQSRRKQFLSHAGQQIRESSSGVIDVAAIFNGPSQATYVATLALSTSPTEEKSVALLFAKKSFARSNEQKVCLALTSATSQAPLLNLTKALDAVPMALLSAQLNFGKDCRTEALADIEATFLRSKERFQYVNESAVAQQCREQMEEGNNALPACLNATQSASKMDEMVLNARYERIPESVKNATYAAYSWARYLGSQFVDENVLSEQVPEGKIVITSKLSPDLHSLNVLVESPLGIAHFNEIPVPLAAQEYVSLSPEGAPPKIWDSLSKMKYGPMCSVGHNQIITFDNATRSLEQNSSWCVMAKYIQRPQQAIQRNNVTVHTRYSEENRKQVLIQSGKNNVSLTYEEESERYRVIVNGKQVPVTQYEVFRKYDKERRPWMSAFVRIDVVLVVEYPQDGILILFDGETVVLRASHLYRGQLRGVCGKFTGNPVNDIKNLTITSCEPGDEPEKDPIDPKDPDDPEPTVRPETTTGLPRSPSLRSRTRVFVESSQICFSLRPQPTCQEGYEPAKQYKKNVPVHCVPHGKAAENLKRAIQKGANPDLSRKELTKTIKVELPQKCVES